jgi:hypothetical protein
VERFGDRVRGFCRVLFRAELGAIPCEISYLKDTTSSPTLSSLDMTKPPEPLLEQEIRLRAYDLYLAARAVSEWLDNSELTAVVITLRGVFSREPRNPRALSSVPGSFGLSLQAAAFGKHGLFLICSLGDRQSF